MSAHANRPGVSRGEYTLARWHDFLLGFTAAELREAVDIARGRLDEEAAFALLHCAHAAALDYLRVAETETGARVPASARGGE